MAPLELIELKVKSNGCANLHAGLGMMDGVLEHVPSARISVVGIYRK